jgi:hypothetical protein
VKKGMVTSENEETGAGASRLDTETGLAPMSSLGVVPVVLLLVSCALALLRRSRGLCKVSCAGKCGGAYLMVLLVLRRIHWGMGRFCFCAFASFCLVRKVLWDCELVRIIRAALSRRREGACVPAS